ncbi:MAG: hypothetical protein M5U19_21700 [Microthrixaceae bacterium]|nr:hypothetical protein [Microthrixaceae bacterium]
MALALWGVSRRHAGRPLRDRRRGYGAGVDRMSTLDAEFLNLEDSNSHMHIAGICTFADPAPTLAELEALIASKIDRIPPLPPASAYRAARAGSTGVDRRSALQPRLSRPPHGAAPPRETTPR